jgi:hypothetical protein
MFQKSVELKSALARIAHLENQAREDSLLLRRIKIENDAIVASTNAACERKILTQTLENDAESQVQKASYESTIADLRYKLNVAEQQKALAVEEAKNEIRKSMQEALITSDIKRTDAVARLEAYQQMDTKADHDKLAEMLTLTIKGLSAPRPVEIVKSN